MDTITVPVFFLRSFPCWFFSLQLADPHSCCKPPSPLPSLALTLPFSKYCSNICYIPGSKHIFFLFYKDPLLCFGFFLSFQIFCPLRTQVVIYFEQGDWLREFTFTIFLGTLWLSTQLVRFKREIDTEEVKGNALMTNSAFSSWLGKACACPEITTPAAATQDEGLPTHAALY